MEDLLEKWKDYKEKNDPVLYILTPTYGGQCFVNYTVSLMNTILFTKSIGLNTCVEFCRNDSLVSRARNNLVAKAMNDSRCTHMVFIDSDISWHPKDILLLMLSDYSLCGGIYPLKNYNFDRAPEICRSLTDQENSSHIQSKLLDYNFNPNKYENVEINNGFVEVRHLATGFMMIKREVISKMKDAYSYTKYVDDIGFLTKEEEKNAYALFDCSVEFGHYLSEDWLFCERWKKLGGCIYANLNINLTHSGYHDFKGSLLNSLSLQIKM